MNTAAPNRPNQRKLRIRWLLPAAGLCLAGVALWARPLPGPGGSNPPGFLSRASGCLHDGFEPSYRADPTGMVEIFGDGREIVCRHRRVVFNCCASPSMTVRASENGLDFFEWENLYAPCDCLCPYDLEGRQADLPDGQYSVRLFRGDSGELLATAVIEIPAYGFTYTVSACQAGSPDGPRESRPGFRLEVGAGYFALIHGGAVQNCCAAMTVSAAQAGQRFDFVEAESFPDGSSPCGCSCPVEIGLRVSGLDPGQYEVHLFGAGKTAELYSGTVIISPPGYRLSASPCLPEGGIAAEEILVQPVHGTLIMKHRQVLLNCCADPMIHLAALGDTLDFIELEHLNAAACDCTCRYDLEGRLDGLAPGLYQISLWRGLYEELLWTGVVEIAEAPYPDLDGNGIIDAADRDLLAGALGENALPSASWAGLTDLNGDGRTDVADLVLLGL